MEPSRLPTAEEVEVQATAECPISDVEQPTQPKRNGRYRCKRKSRMHEAAKIIEGDEHDARRLGGSVDGVFGPAPFDSSVDEDEAARKRGSGHRWRSAEMRRKRSEKSVCK